MPLETLGDSQKLNIQKIEGPETRTNELSAIKQDVKHVLSEWQNLTSKLSFEQNPETQRMLELIPDKIYSRLTPDFLLEKTRGAIDQMIANEDFLSLPEIIKQTRILYPGISLANLNISPEILKKVISDIEVVQSRDLVEFLNKVSSLISVCPELRSEFNLYDDSYFLIYSEVREGDQAHIIQIIADSRIVFPEQFKREKILPKIKFLLETIRAKRDSYYELSRQIYLLRLLAADRIELTDHGIVFHDDLVAEFKTETPPLPETKKS